MHGIFEIFYKIVPKTFVMFILIGFKNLYHLIPYMKWGLQLRLGPPKNWRPRVDGASSYLEAPILKLEAPNFSALCAEINLGPPQNFFPEYALEREPQTLTCMMQKEYLQKSPYLHKMKIAKIILCSGTLLLMGGRILPGQSAVSYVPIFSPFQHTSRDFFKNILFASCMYELRAYSVKKFCQKMHGKCVFQGGQE